MGPHFDNGPEWRNSGAYGLAQADYLLSKHTKNIANVAGVNREGVGVVWQKREEEGYGIALYPDKDVRFQ